MTRDALDDLLDASTPARQTVDTKDLRAMLAEARAQHPAPRRRRRTAILSGALALLFIGGAGVATAAGDWLWGGGAGRP